MLLLLSSVLIGCAADDEKSGGLEDDGLQEERDALAEELWPMLDGYADWEQVDPWTGIQVSSDGTHGEYVQIWLDPVAAGSYADDVSAPGSIIAKKGYRDAEGTDPYGNLTVMWKPEDDTAVPVTGWLWVSFASDGSFTKAQDDEGCASCHSPGVDWRRMKTDVPGGG